MTTLREEIEIASKHVEKIFAEQGELIPMWDVFTADGKRGIIGTPFSGEASKEAITYALRQMFEEFGVVRYVFVTEAWTLRQGLSEAETRKALKASLENHPDRREIIQLTGEDTESGQILAFREIIRNADGSATLGPLEWMLQGAGVWLEGRMIGLLPRKGSVQ